MRTSITYCLGSFGQNDSWVRLAKCTAFSCPHAEEPRLLTRTQSSPHSGAASRSMRARRGRPRPSRRSLRSLLRTGADLEARALFRVRTDEAHAEPRLVAEPFRPSRRIFFRPGFAPFASLTPIEGGAERRETFGCSAEHPLDTP